MTQFKRPSAFQVKTLSADDSYNLTCGSSLKAHIEGITYDDIVAILGEPTHAEPSGDNKVQFEWDCFIKHRDGFSGDVVTLYDWKTYDREHSRYELDHWNIGGFDRTSAENLRKYLLGRLEELKESV